MFPAPIQHRFTIDGESYLLVEYDTLGEDRIRMTYARAIAEVPGVLDVLYGMDLYCKAVAYECLKEAPASLWRDVPPVGNQNGTAGKTLTFEGMHRLHWEALRKEVDAFLALLPQSLPTPAEGPLAPVPANTGPVAPVETIPPVFRGQAG